VTYQVYATALGSAAPVGNIILDQSLWQFQPTQYLKFMWCAGNKLTVTGSPFTAAELGTASSAQEGVIGGGA
jgi:hypothetical protein